jgi:hypothetical protein
VERLKRKPYLFGLAAALIVVAAAVHFARPSKAESPRLERYLPADAVGFVEVNDLRGQALKVIDSEAWRAFTKENQAASSLFMMTANHTGALDASYAVALLGVGANSDGKREPQFAVVAEFNNALARRTFENRALRLAQAAGGNGVETKTEQYGGAAINTVTPQGKHGFSYAQVEDTLYVSNSADAVKRLLDVRAGKGAATLETNPNFAQARARAKSVDGMFGFLDGAALTNLIDNAQADNKGVAAFREFFHGVGASSVQSVAFTSTFEDGRVAERAFVVAPNRAGLLATAAANPPTQGALLALVPDDAVAAFDASIANAPQTFEQMVALGTQLSEQSGKKSPADALAEFTEKTGVDFRGEILNSLGTEFCAAQLTAGDSPSGVVILNLKDKQTFAQALAKLIQSKQRTTSQRDYNGATIYHVDGQNGRYLEYAFVGDNFVASGKGAAVERVIDTAQGGHSLKSSAAYASASAAAASGQPQFVYFNSNADYLNRLGHALKSSDDTFKTDGQSATLRPSFAFGVTQPDGFYVESRTPLGAFPRLLSAVTSKLGAEKKQQKDNNAE